MPKATEADAVEYTPEATGEPALKIKGVLADAAREVRKVAPLTMPPEAILTDDLTINATTLKIAPPRSVTPFNERVFLVTAMSFPATGVLRIGNEDIEYANRDTETEEFLGLVRGYEDTEAAAHLAGAKVYDAGYEYAFFDAQLRAFDYLWKTSGVTEQYSNQAVGATGTFVSRGGLHKILREVMGEYALGARPVPITFR
jgi:hypothetical protein